MIKKVKKGDLIVVKSVDRLGRNYKEIGEKRQYLTQKKSVNICAIDMPILDTRSVSSDLIEKFIADLILQLLSFIAENERNNIKQRQAEGIKIAKLNGIKFERTPFIITDDFKESVQKYKKRAYS